MISSSCLSSGAPTGAMILQAHRQFAHRLIDEAGVCLVHGQSSHHPIGVEIYRGRPILCGCGDFINDYEGIRGYEALRPHLALAYFVDIDDRVLSRFRNGAVSADKISSRARAVRRRRMGRRNAFQTQPGLPD